MVSCTAKKQVAATKKPADTSVTPSPVLSKLNAIRASQVNFNTFSARAKAKIDINGNSNDVTLNVRINKGHKIWVSITALIGIEVARAVITPDSILVINKFQGVYLRKPFSYIYKYASRRLDYNSVEALMVGNAIPQFLTDDVVLKPDSGNVVLSGNMDELIFKMIAGPDLKITQTNLSNQFEEQSLQVNNNSFMQAASRSVPSQININSTVKTNKVRIGIRYIKMDFDQPLEYPFSIPEGYPEAN